LIRGGNVTRKLSTQQVKAMRCASGAESMNCPGSKRSSAERAASTSPRSEQTTRKEIAAADHLRPPVQEFHARMNSRTSADVPMTKTTLAVAITMRKYHSEFIVCFV